MSNVFDSAALFSPCRKYRYTLWRRWADGWQTNYCMFVGLNPSTADEVQDDPTVRRCIRYAKDWGYGALCMTNMFAYRATDPADMLAQADPNGEDNDDALLQVSAQASIIVCAWGNHGLHLGRHMYIREQLLADRKLHYLRLNKSGTPAHPLYLPASLRPMLYSACD